MSIRFLKLEDAIIAYYGSEMPVSGDEIVCVNKNRSYYGEVRTFALDYALSEWKKVLWHIETLPIGTQVTCKPSAPLDVRLSEPFRNGNVPFVHSYVIVKGSNYIDMGGICKYKYAETITPFLAVRLVFESKYLGTSLYFTVPADEIELAKKNFDACVYDRHKAPSWAAGKSVRMRFVDRADAIRFGKHLANYTGREIRLGFLDMTGNGNDNGTYIQPDTWAVNMHKDPKKYKGELN